VSLLARAHLTQRKISDVALSSGFNDVSYFHRCFRRRFGMTLAGART
jgi:AraC-like DNA-binding protein